MLTDANPLIQRPELDRARAPSVEYLQNREKKCCFSPDYPVKCIMEGT